MREDQVMTYAVGLLADYRCRHLLSGIKRVLRWARAGNWRAVKNSFNGYLAEPSHAPWPEGAKRCGSGWTRRRALRSWDRQLQKARRPQ